MSGRSTSAEAVLDDGGSARRSAELRPRTLVDDVVTAPHAALDRVVSFKEVYDEHFRFVWRSLRRLGVPESDVADAVQDVFLVVHRRLCEFEGRSKVSTWLYGICYRVARDRRRLAHVRRRADDDGDIDERPDERADVAAAAERRQGLELLDSI